MSFWKGVLNVVGSIPVIGHVTAGVQFIAGDKEGAQKSFAASTANPCSTAVGGPPGAVAEGAAGSALGGQLENKLNGKDFDFSASKLLADAAIGGVGGLAGGGGAESLLKSAGSMIGREVSKTTVKVAAGTGLKTLLASTATQLVQAVGDEISSPGSSPRHGEKEDTPPPDEKMRIVTRNQDAKAREIETHCSQLEAQCHALGMPSAATYHARSLCSNVAMPFNVIRHPLPWDTANMAFQSIKSKFDYKKQEGEFMQDQHAVDETSHGYDVWPEIDAGRVRLETLLEELRVAMEEVEYMMAHPLP